jgi:hypothetical protein
MRDRPQKTFNSESFREQALNVRTSNVEFRTEIAAGAVLKSKV